MTTALLERRPEIMERAAELQSQVAAMQEKLQTLLRASGDCRLSSLNCTMTRAGALTRKN